MTWTTNLQEHSLPKKKRSKHVHPEGSEEKENIPEHAEGSYSRSDYQTPNRHQMKAIFECAEGLNALFNLLLLLLSTP